MKNIPLLLFSIFSLMTNAQLKKVTYLDGAQKLNGFSGIPETKSDKSPGVLILPAWKGITDHEKQVAAELNKMGYFTFIADIYGEGNYPVNTQEAGKQSGYYKKNFLEYQRRISLALEQLLKLGANSQNIVAIGYCFGGTGVLESARAQLDLKGVVSFHGGLGKDKARPDSVIKTKVLILHGADDPYVPKEEILGFETEMRHFKADWQMIYYANAVHAFTEKSAGNDNSKGAAYNELADKRSWEHLKVFLQEVFSR